MSITDYGRGAACVRFPFLKDDIHGAAHDRAFVVAGAMKADLIDDIRQAVDKAIAKGAGFKAFQKDFAALVKKHGWHDYTGDFEWRTRIIYQTNMRTSYSAGRWAQMTSPDAVKAFPFWRYKHSDSVEHPRPLHVSWDGLTLRWDDPWIKTHYTPNGYGCRCKWVPVPAHKVPNGPDKAPDNGTYEWTDGAGNVHDVPLGVDPGWGYAPGASVADDVRRLVEKKVAKLPKDLGEAFGRDAEEILGRKFTGLPPDKFPEMPRVRHGGQTRINCPTNHSIGPRT